MNHLALALALATGCASLVQREPVFGPLPTLQDATPPQEASEAAPGHYDGVPFVVTAPDGTGALALAPAEYAYLLAVETWALGWMDDQGVRHPGLLDAYGLCVAGRADDRGYCEGQVRARALALQACRRELPRAFLAGTGVGGVLGAGACGAVAGAAGGGP